MSRTVLKVENLSKLYRLGEVGTGTLSHDLNRWWHRVRGKDDPYQRLGEANDRSSKGAGEYVWSLKDVSFQVKEGEVLGVIGKNGAGKSTLLKILSQVTSPTKGEVNVKGRIASLLEVGTGFHPELTGRENIFLNGAILGMTKREITSKLDEIVAFSGVERFIDTPVKRYSSGMMVRLGFSVAAHLEPEILIVDEVLAVGDADFQKKCLGKMKDVSGEGRTVLFVSHNMPSIRMLCTSCMMLDKGMSVKTGTPEDVISHYLSANDAGGIQGTEAIPQELSVYNTGEGKFLTAVVMNSKGMKATELEFLDTLRIRLTFKANKRLENVFPSVFIVNQYGDRVLMAVENEKYKPLTLESGITEFTIRLNEKLMPGVYSLGMSMAHFHTGAAIDYVESFYPFTVSKESAHENIEYPWETVHGYIKPETEWKINLLKNGN
jgi:lipopolysaccharide transport system ATP-binding protein